MIIAASFASRAESFDSATTLTARSSYVRWLSVCQVKDTSLKLPPIEAPTADSMAVER
jgi:hypothetical protein